MISFPNELKIGTYEASFMQIFPRCFSSIFSDSILFSHLLRIWWHEVAESVKEMLYKVAGSIPDGLSGSFNWRNPSSSTMALGSTQPRTETGTRNISWG